MSESIVVALLTRLESRFEKLESRFDNLEFRFEKLESRFENLESRIEVGLARLEARQTQLEISLIAVRTDVMGRMDRLQDTVKSMRDDIIVNFGRADRVSLVAASASSEVRALGVEVSAMETQTLRLRGDLDEMRRSA